MIVVYPGSFDPVTYGHIDIITRASKLFDRVIVAVLQNKQKSPLFTTEERVQMMQKSVRQLPNVEVDHFDDLLVNYLKLKDARAIIRGIRSVSDFEYELQLANINSQLEPEVEMVFMMTNSKYSYLSSSVVREIAKFKGPVHQFVPDVVEEALRKKFTESTI